MGQTRQRRPDSLTVQSTERLDERSMYIGKEIIKEIESRLRSLPWLG